MVHETVPDDVVYHNRIWWMQEWVKSLWNFSKFHTWAIKYLLKVLVTIDEFSLMRILNKQWNVKKSKSTVTSNVI